MAVWSFRDPQEVTARWVLSQLSLEAWGLGDHRTGAERRACGPLHLACQRTGEEELLHTALLPAPAPVEPGLRRWLCPQAGLWGWLRLLGLAQVPRQAPWSQGPLFLFL